MHFCFKYIFNIVLMYHADPVTNALEEVLKFYCHNASENLRYKAVFLFYLQMRK